FEQAQVFRVVAHLIDRDLVRAPKAFDLLTIDFLGTGPAFWAPQDDQRPSRRLRFIVWVAALARQLLNRLDILNRRLEDRRHALVHWERVRACDHDRFIPIPRNRPTISSSGILPRMVGLAILYPLRCRMGSTAPSEAGLRKVLQRHDAES